MNRTINADFMWTRLVNNQMFLQQLFKGIVTEAGKEKDCFLMGVCIVGNDLSDLYDAQTHDLVNFSQKEEITSLVEDGNVQRSFNSLETFLRMKMPMIEKTNVYLIADATGGREENGYGYYVHWNCFIIRDYIQWFDSAGEGNFNPVIRKRVNSFFSMLKERETRFLQYPQVFVDHSLPSVDFFCQTWVLIFVHVLISDELETFTHLDFVNIQQELVKIWIMSMKKYIDDDWFSDVNDYLLKRHRFVDQRNNKSKCVKTPEFVLSSPVIKNIMTYYSNFRINEHKKRRIE